MLSSLEYLVELNKEHKRNYDITYKKHTDKVVFERNAVYTIVKNNASMYYIVNKHKSGLQGRTSINKINDIYKFYKNSPNWYITNISILREMTWLLDSYLLNRKDWERIYTILEAFELEEFCIIREKNIRDFVGKALLTGKYNILDLDNINNPFYKICISKDNKKVLLISDLKLVVDDNTNFRLNSLNIKHIRIDNIITDGEISLEYCFSSCKKTESIELYNFDTSKVRLFSGMFFNCNSLKKLDIRCMNTESAVTFYTMFYGCSALEELDLNHFKVDKISSVNNMFDNCSNLKKLKINTWILKDELEEKGVYTMFNGCPKLHLTSIPFLKYKV